MDFTLCWLLKEGQYALVYNSIHPPGLDGDDYFVPKEREARLPTTQHICSLALLNGDPIKDVATVQCIEDGGLVLGTVFRSGDGKMRPDFRGISLSDLKVPMY